MLVSWNHLRPDRVLRVCSAGFMASCLGGVCVAQTAAPAPRTISCVSQGAERKHCAADASGGVALLRSTGKGSCLLGRTWGYDDDGVWVSESCGGEFALGSSTRVSASA